MTIWTVYDHPSDYPDGYVARRWEVGADRMQASVTDVMTSSELEPLREVLRERGLFAFPRQPGDDPVIVEVWF